MTDRELLNAIGKATATDLSGIAIPRLPRDETLHHHMQSLISDLWSIASDSRDDRSKADYQMRLYLELHSQLPPDLEELIREAVSRALNAIHRPVLDFVRFVFGSAVSASHFDRVHGDKTLPRSDVEQLRNGFLEPVLVFGGGWRSQIRLQPVSTDWRDVAVDLARQASRGQTYLFEVETDYGAGHMMTVACTTRAHTRLLHQIEISRNGDYFFLDAKERDDGFVAIDRAWWAERFRRRSGSRSRADIEAQLESAQAAAAEGEEVLLLDF